MTKVNVSIGMKPVHTIIHTPAVAAARGKSAHFARAAVPFADADAER